MKSVEINFEEDIKKSFRPVDLAAYFGNQEVFEYLFDKSVCKPKTQFYSVHGGNVDILKIVMSKGYTLTPNDFCRASEKEMIDFIIDKIDINSSNSTGMPLLSYVISQPFPEKIYKVEKLLEKGADPNRCNNDGLSPLWWATRYTCCPTMTEIAETIRKHEGTSDKNLKENTSIWDVPFDSDSDDDSDSDSDMIVIPIVNN